MASLCCGQFNDFDHTRLADGSTRRGLFILPGLEMLYEHGHRQAGEQGNGKLEAIVRVELQFRQQVAAGDTEKSSSTEGQRAAEKGGVGIGKMICSKIKQNRADWT